MTLILRTILSKLIWIGIGILLTLLLLATICKSEPQTVTIGDGITFSEVWGDMTKPRFPHLIFIPSEDKVDTFIVYADTPISEIPQQTKITEFPIPVYVNDKPDHHYGTAKFYYVGIADSVQFHISEKRITLPTTVDNFDFYAGLTVWVDQSKKMSVDFESGVRYRNRFGLKAKAEADHEYKVKLKAGISVGI